MQQTTIFVTNFENMFVDTDNFNSVFILYPFSTVSMSSSNKFVENTVN